MKTTTITGTDIRELTSEEKRTLGIRYGLKITGPVGGSLKEDTNLAEGFIITAIDGNPIRSLSELKLYLEKTDGVMIEGIYADGTHARYYTKGFHV